MRLIDLSYFVGCGLIASVAIGFAVSEVQYYRSERRRRAMDVEKASVRPLLVKGRDYQALPSALPPLELAAALEERSRILLALERRGERASVVGGLPELLQQAARQLRSDRSLAPSGPALLTWVDHGTGATH